MNEKLLQKVPQKYHVAIKEVWEDDDGYWCMLHCDGEYKLIGYYADYTIHEDTLKDFLAAFKLIKKRTR